jgi:hypothetical protein
MFNCIKRENIEKYEPIHFQQDLINLCKFKKLFQIKHLNFRVTPYRTKNTKQISITGLCNIKLDATLFDEVKPLYELAANVFNICYDGIESFEFYALYYMLVDYPEQYYDMLVLLMLDEIEYLNDESNLIVSTNIRWR